MNPTTDSRFCSIPIDRKKRIFRRNTYSVVGNRRTLCDCLGVIRQHLRVLHGVSNLSGLLLKMWNDPGLSGCIFIALSVMIPVQIKFGAESARVLMAGICFSLQVWFCLCRKLQEKRRWIRSTELLWHHHTETFLDRREFCGKHRSCADFVWDQCKIYGETGDLEEFKDAGFHVCM